MILGDSDMKGVDPILELDEQRPPRAKPRSDDDISPLKYYGAYLLVIVMFDGFTSQFFV